MTTLPTGTVTFLFTDVEGSTRLWEEHPEPMRQAAARHDELIEAAVAAHGGVVVRPRGEGDSRFAVFARATDALTAAAAAQLALHAEPWPMPQPLRVRAALHTGEADLRDGDYYGTAVNRCARLRAIAHGGQTLVSRATYDLVRGARLDGLGLRDLGEQRLRDLGEPEHVFALVVPGVPDTAAPLRSLDQLPNNLPLQVTTFVGREKELAEVKALLAGPTRLVTLTGTGGAGKTRLSLQAAADLLDDYPDGVWFVDLARVGDPALAAQTTLDALGAREVPGQPPEAALVDHLREKRALLILDNCEHLVESAARLADRIVRQCPAVRVLATSREMLGVPGERAWRVPPLSVPDPRHAETPEELERYEAVRLFVDRARLVQPEFAVTAANAAALAQVCARLDGIPLALELAAARVRVLPVEQIAQRLDQRFRLLTGGGRTALRRQQTLQALVDWSHDLLNDAERALFRRLAVFAGGWTLDAAEQVCGFAPLEAFEVLDLLTSLVDKSLVVAEAHRGRERYRFLETMRQYAEQKLFDAGEAETVRNSHRDRWLAISREIAPQPGIGNTVGTARMLPEHDNIRAALGWCLANDGVKPGLEMAGLVHFLRSLPEQREWLEALLRRAPEPTAARAMTLLRLGHVLRWLHEFSLARGTAEEATALYRGLDDPVGEDDARAALGLALGNLGDYAGAIPQIEAGLASARTRRDTPKVVQYTRDLAVVSTAAGEFPRARAALEESMSLARQSEAAWPAHNASLRLALVDRLEGDHARSRARLDEVLGVIDDPTSWAGVQVRSALANLARTEGRPEEALTELRACLRDAMRHGYAVNEVLCMVGIAEIEAGRTARGVRTIAAGSPDDGPPGTVHMPDVRVEVPHYLARARETLGEAAYQEAWQAGRETPLERAVAAALADTAG